MNNLFRKLFPSKEIREYRKMHRRHRKELVKLAKETKEYDWCWLYQSTIMQIKHMYEYYFAGNNVWQVDESRMQIVEELKRVLDLVDELERLDNDCCGVEFIYEDDGIVHRVAPDDFLERYNKKMAREQELYEEIYSLIGKNLQGWWD